MSARVCSPPMMDTREILLSPTCPSGGGNLASLPSSATQPAPSLPPTLTYSDLGMRKAVSRALFGDPDPARTSQYARQKLLEIRKEDVNKWNFDFEAETPLEGRYKWEAIERSREMSMSSESSDAKLSSPNQLPPSFHSKYLTSSSPKLEVRDSLLIVRTGPGSAAGRDVGERSSQEGASPGSSSPQDLSFPESTDHVRLSSPGSPNSVTVRVEPKSHNKPKTLTDYMPISKKRRAPAATTTAGKKAAL